MLEIISGASPVVLAVLILLATASIASWAVIVLKFRELGAADRQTRGFIEAYQGGTLEAVYAEVRNYAASPLATVFRAGFRELAQLEKQQAKRAVTPDQAETVIKRLGWVRTEEALRLERGLSFLATIGSSAPFIGLFGTVVGIMNSFHQIGQSGAASFSVVAPGIAEALFATAVGLFAAIPAVIAYNYCSARHVKLLDRLDAFVVDYSDLLRRSVSSAA
ncbi:MAG TPA: MotA/TolQ/ExbB proton channel family protein [Myxococcota bacterium]|nr:MotA/TolQ/ExbB proton channel family protein [Myxococcota bacterium]